MSSLYACEINVPDWVLIALSEVGTAELDGNNNNKRILEYHKKTSLKATQDSVPWCSSFLCWVFEECGIESTKNAMAKSWLNWGIKLDKPLMGCVCVFSRGDSINQGHVGLYLDEDSQFIYLLGGNQGDRVSIRIYSKNKLLEYRWPNTFNRSEMI